MGKIGVRCVYIATIPLSFVMFDKISNSVHMLRKISLDVFAFTSFRINARPCCSHDPTHRLLRRLFSSLLRNASRLATRCFDFSFHNSTTHCYVAITFFDLTVETNLLVDLNPTMVPLPSQHTQVMFVAKHHRTRKQPCHLL